MRIRRGHALTGFVGVLMICQVAFGQVSLTPHHAPFLTSDQIAAAVRTEAAASSIVSQALAERLRIFPNNTTTVIAAQIPENWLPAIPGVQFRRLTDDAAREHLQQCGRILYVRSFGLLTDKLATIVVEEGNACSGFGQELRFRRVADGWHLETDFFGSVLGGVTSGCDCR